MLLLAYCDSWERPAFMWVGWGNYRWLFTIFFSIVVFRCLRYASDLLHFVSEILSEVKVNGISGTFHFFSFLFIGYMLLFIYSFDIILKFLAFRLKSGISPYAAEIISSYLLEPVVVLLTKFSWQAEFQLKAGIWRVAKPQLVSRSLDISRNSTTVSIYNFAAIYSDLQYQQWSRSRGSFEIQAGSHGGTRKKVNLLPLPSTVPVSRWLVAHGTYLLCYVEAADVYRIK